jgi:hypothetical protein
MHDRPLRKLYSHVRGVILDFGPLWWAPRRRRVWLLTTAVLILILLLGLLLASVVTFPNADAYCGTHPFGCGVISSSTATILVAAVAALLWLGLVQHELVLHRYLRRVRTSPAPLLDGTIESDYVDLFGRDAFCNELLDELRSSRLHAPIFILGESGSGKTAVLLTIAQKLSMRRLVPVLVSLRGQRLPISLASLAKNEFIDQIDSILWTETHGDRIWRRLRRSGRVVLLLDGLDEGFADAVHHQWQFAMHRTFSPEVVDLPIIVACRTQAAPDGLLCSRYTMPRLDDLQYESVGVVSDSSASSAQRGLVLRDLDVGAVPFFLSVLRDRPDLLTLDISASDVTRSRKRLIEQWLAPLTAEHRISLGAVGLAFLSRNAYECSHSEVVTLASQIGNIPDADVALAVDSALDSRVLHLRSHDNRELLQPRHPLLLTYLASLALSNLWDARCDAVITSGLPEAAEALAWAAAGDSACADQWMKRANQIQSSALAATAMVRVAILCSKPLPDQFPSVCVDAEWRSESEKLELIRAIGCLVPDPVAVRTLIGFLRDSSYASRWASARCLGERGTSGDGVDRWIEVELNELSNKEFRNANPLALQEGVLWVTPSRVEVDRSRSFNVRRLGSTVAEARRDGEPGYPGAESSLAQGLKLAASLGRPLDLQIIRDVLASAEFWFARFEATFAIGYAASAGATEEIDDLIDAAEMDVHPLVRAAGTAARRVALGGPCETHLWVNERESIANCSALTPDSLLLLADTVLWLSLCSTGTPAKRDVNASRTTLPRCMSHGQDRFRLLEQADCMSTCGFEVCPLDNLGSDYWSRGPFPEEFSRNVRHAVRRVGPPPWYEGRARSYIATWKALEVSMAFSTGTRSAKPELRARLR